MDNKELLLKKLSENYHINLKNVVYKEIDFKKNVVDIYKLMSVSFICEEDLEKNLYVVETKTGFFDMAFCYLAFKIENEKIYIVAYGKEGLIKQNICEKAINKIINNI